MSNTIQSNSSTVIKYEYKDFMYLQRMENINLLQKKFRDISQECIKVKKLLHPKRKRKLQNL